MRRAHARRLAATRRHLAGPAVLLTALAVLAAACGRAPQAPAGTPSPTATATPVSTPVLPPAQPLAWTPHVLPASQRPMLGLAQSDGNTAYVCAPAPGAATDTAEVWVTHDRGSQWPRRANVVTDVGTDATVTGCAIVVDALNPATAAAQIALLPASGCVAECTFYETFVTFDSGQTWTLLHKPQGVDATPSEPQGVDTTLFEFATRQGVTYALFRSFPGGLSAEYVPLMMSTDRMRTWTPLSGPPLPPQPFPGAGRGDVLSFWLNPLDGGLLVITTSGIFNSEQFWTSSDAGQHWTQIKDPPFPFDFGHIIVQRPFTEQPWRLCGADPVNFGYVGRPQNTHIRDVACTPDGGATWVTRHMDVPDNASGFPEYDLVAIADDGSVLVTVPSGLARFTPGSPRLDLLGPVPNAGALGYAAGMGMGVLWAGPMHNVPDDDPQGRIFTASYA